MNNILLVGENPLLWEDLKSQLALYADDFAVFDDIDGDTVFDVAVIDEQADQVALLRQKLPKTPLILLLSSGVEAETGAATLIRKPMRLENLLDTIRASVNLFANSRDGLLRFNRYELNPGGKTMLNLRNREKIKLTEREVAILQYLYRARNKIVSKNELLSEVWGYNPEATTHTVETHIYRLRQKVEHDRKEFQIIITEDNGYKLKL